MTHPITQDAAPSKERARRKNCGYREVGTARSGDRGTIPRRWPFPEGSYSTGPHAHDHASATCPLTPAQGTPGGALSFPSAGPVSQLGDGPSVHWGQMLVEGTVGGMFSQGASAAALQPSLTGVFKQGAESWHLPQARGAAGRGAHSSPFEHRLAWRFAFHTHNWAQVTLWDA